MGLKEFIESAIKTAGANNFREACLPETYELAFIVDAELDKLAKDFTSGQTALVNEIEELRARVSALEHYTVQDKAD